MPISNAIYSVYLDGRATQRGLTYEEAHRHANYLANGICRHKASDKRRAPEIEVKMDKQLLHDEDALYRWAKQGG